MSDRWIEVAWHPDGYVLSDCTEEMIKARGRRGSWVKLRLAHPDWAEYRKRDRYAWLEWNTAKRRLFPVARSPISQQFENEHPEAHAWVTQIMAGRQEMGLLHANAVGTAT